MSAPLTRIFSDLHLRDRASSLHELAQIEPLFAGASAIVFNGDTLETRPGPRPRETAALRDTLATFCARSAPPVTVLTGNHDPDFTPHHHLELAGGELVVTHGDVLFDDLVPWSQDAPLARELVAGELARLSPPDRHDLSARLSACRRAAAALPQRHQAEKHGLRHLIGLARDTVWPPSRILRVLRAWRETPARAENFLREHRPQARFLAMGHTHRLGAVRTPLGFVVLNTGSFCAPSGTGVIDVTADRIALRRVVRRRAEFQLGDTLAAFSLAGR